MNVVCKFFDKKDLKRDGIKNSCGVCKHYVEDSINQCDKHDLIVKIIKEQGKL